MVIWGRSKLWLHLCLKKSGGLCMVAQGWAWWHTCIPALGWLSQEDHEFSQPGPNSNETISQKKKKKSNKQTQKKRKSVVCQQKWKLYWNSSSTNSEVICHRFTSKFLKTSVCLITWTFIKFFLEAFSKNFESELPHLVYKIYVLNILCVQVRFPQCLCALLL